MDIKKELIDAIQVIVNSAIGDFCPTITFGVVTKIGQKNYCTVQLNNIEYELKYYGETPPNINCKYPVFIPSNNMSMAFIINGGLGGMDWNSVLNKPTTVSGYGIVDAPIFVQFSLSNSTITSDKMPSELHSIFTTGGCVFGKIYNEEENVYYTLTDVYSNSEEIVFLDNINKYYVVGNIEQDTWTYVNS